VEVALDTNALSDFAAGSDALGEVLMPFRSLALPVTVLGEYRYGLLGSKKKARLEQWLDDLLNDVRVLEVSARTSSVYALVRQQLRTAGTPIPENDVWIAAIAIEQGLPLATRDKHFNLVKGLELVGW
jgi:predicted nucleic acid-binding protein